MKSYIKHTQALCLLALGAMLSFTACDDYLSIVPKGEKIPTTLADFEAMLRDEYGCQRVDPAQAIILMNDRWVSAANLSYYPLWKANYNWDETANRIELNKSDETMYYACYSDIATFNLLIENVPTATEGTEADKKVVIAQAKVLRAMTYFNLVNYYSDTYVAATAADKGGVPLITSADIGAAYTQPSVQGIYDFMLKDMQEAYPDLPEKSATILHPDIATADAFYARLYLQMGDYENALTYANKALAINDKLFDWVGYYNQHAATITDLTDTSTRLPSPMGFDYVENYDYRHGSTSYSGSESGLTLERAARFEKGDARMAARWKYYDAGNDPYYRSMMTGYYNYSGMTTVEVYLIKAECLARSGKYTDAMDVLNKVRQTRILPADYQPLTATDEATAMSYIIRTKQNEMILTQVPFMDARRLNAEGKYPVKLTKTLDGKQISLAVDSHLWTMPFPQGATDNTGNGSIKQNVSL
jgi:tetratricopeptide (TPR) repeat protein